MADFFTNYLMTGAKIRVIDVGYSYVELCSILKGQYIRFSEDAAMCLNFFTNVQLNKEGMIHDDELQKIIQLVGLMAMQSLSPEDSGNDLDIPVLAGHISQAITMAFKDRKRGAGMQDVLIALEKIKVSLREDSG
jgi:conjugal transfer ATP-binding protein TraC